MEIGINHLRRMAITWQKRIDLKNGIPFLFYLISFIISSSMFDIWDVCIGRLAGCQFAEHTL